MWDFARSILNAYIFRVLHYEVWLKDIVSGVEVKVGTDVLFISKYLALCLSCSEHSNIY